MSSLRVRIAMLLVVLILAVEIVLTGAMFLLLRPPGPPRSIEPVARQVLLLAALARDGTTLDPRTAPLAAELPPGVRERGLTEWLRHTLLEMGSDLAVEVRRPLPPGPFQVAIPVANRGWLMMPVPDLPPPGGAFGPLAQWLTVITLTALAVALFAAYRMTRPLALLEDTINRVGPDATLPLLPERGPAEVKATAQAINRLSARLKAAIESRMRLVAAAGHDLRTPMTRMRLRAEFLDPAERGPWLQDLDELDRIADSAIALVREQVVPEDVGVLRLDRLTGATIEELKRQGFAVSQATLEPAEVMASALAISRALRNLIINAATHGGAAQVSLSRSGAFAEVVIEDDGPGIPEANLAQVFEPFFRLDPGRSGPGHGAGLGMSIAHEIVTRAGGSIAIANRNGHGLRQTVRLPLHVA